MADRVNIPDIVYKYLDLETGIEKVLKEKTIKFSKPSSFNDPFDCYEKLIEPDVQLPKEILENPNIDKNILSENIRKSYYDVLKDNAERNKISCFSKSHKEILMWSHYGEKHAGICIGIEVEKVKNKAGLIEIDYVDSFNVLPYRSSEKYCSENRDALEHLIKVKSSSWKYEEEIRWLIYGERELWSFQDLGEIVIKEVIFGLKVSFEKVKNKIKELQLYGYENVNFYQMKSVPNEFRIEKELINKEDIF